MENFKRLMYAYHTQNKTHLHELYTDRQVYYSSLSSFDQPVEDEKLFEYRTVSFQFIGTGFRTPEQMVLHVWISENILHSLLPEADGGIGDEFSSLQTACGDWLLRLLGTPVNALSESFRNDHKDTREKASFAAQEPGPVVLARNGCLYVADRSAFRLKILCRLPLINGSLLNGKNSYKCVKALLDLICDRLETADRMSLTEHLRLYSRQLQLRAALKEKGLLAFIADGSILPRQGTTQNPLPDAVPFQSPPSLRVTLRTQDGHTLTGMGIKPGVTVITGGGYSGKSTLLDCLEQGIYDHVGGDGREYLFSDESACKIYAEDGRYLSSTDLSPFFTWLPGNSDLRCVRTPRASGSVSQAAGIVEAVYGGSRCLLIDEDTSAANFMMRDGTMRRLIKKEPIIPFTDRILDLKGQGISTVLVIGGSGEYLKYADQILLLEDYLASDVTDQIRGSAIPAAVPGSFPPAAGTYSWMRRKPLSALGGRAEEGADFSPGQCVRIENARFLKIGSLTADITRLTALTESAQADSLIRLLEKLLSRLSEEDCADADLRENCEAAAEALFCDSMDAVLSSRAHQYEQWLEQIRSLDLILAACRLRPDTML